FSGSGGLNLTIDSGVYNDTSTPTPVVSIKIDGRNGPDLLSSVENIRLSGGNDTVTIAAGALSQLSQINTVDGGKGRNTLDLRQISKNYTFENNKIKGYDTVFKNFTELKADPGDDTVILKGPDASSWREVDFGDGNDTIDSSDPNLIINF